MPVKLLWFLVSPLQKMLSISEAVLEFTLVGFVIHGNNEWEYITSANLMSRFMVFDIKQRDIEITKTGYEFLLSFYFW